METKNPGGKGSKVFLQFQYFLRGLGSIPKNNVLLGGIKNSGG